jgi:hypothetical protein
MMNDFKNMKIRTTDPATAQKVQEALYKLDYFWHEMVPDSSEYKFLDDCYGIKTYGDGCIVRFSLNEQDVEEGFKHDDSEEYILTPQGTFMKPEDYFKQPETPPVKQRSPFFGLKPRRIHDKERMQDLLEEMLRYVEAGWLIPHEWVNELAELSVRQEWVEK